VRIRPNPSSTRLRFNTNTSWPTGRVCLERLNRERKTLKNVKTGGKKKQRPTVVEPASLTTKIISLSYWPPATNPTNQGTWCHGIKDFKKAWDGPYLGGRRRKNWGHFRSLYFTQRDQRREKNKSPQGEGWGKCSQKVRALETTTISV